jgi:hypothetical protein
MLRECSLAAAAAMAASLFVFMGCDSDPASLLGEPEPEQQAGQEGPYYCGGIGGLVCPEGYTCTDNAFDGCDTAHGGADCLGFCVPEEECDTDARGYMSLDPSFCAKVLIRCAPGFAPFADECGCGCEPRAICGPECERDER